MTVGVWAATSEKTDCYWIFWFGGHQAVSDVDRLASLLNQACSSLYERGVLEALRVLNDYKFLLPVLDIKRF
jgi:hypothetical protein